MKFKFWVFVLTAYALSSCTSEEPATPPEVPDSNAITMNAYVNDLVRNPGVDATAEILKSGISVYAYKTGAYSSTPFMNNVIFKNAANTTYWSSTPVYYWPSYPLDFFGFYPTTVAPTNLATPGEFTYTTSANAADQNDVVVGFAGNQTREQEVPLQFHHALSKVAFIVKVKGNSGLTVTVKNISIKNINLSGNFTLSPTATAVPNYFNVVATGSANAAATIQPASPVVIAGSTADVASNPISGLYLVPQNTTLWSYGDASSVSYPLTSGAYININGSLTGVTDYTGDIAIPITPATTTSTSLGWKSGMFYTYTIVFGTPGGDTGGGGYNPNQPATGNNNKPQKILVPILIEVAVDEWQNANEPEIIL